MSGNGRLEAIWIKRARRGPMDSVDRTTAVADAGLVGCADQGGRRQVTVIERETFDRIRQDLPDARPFMRRANLMVSGIRLEESRGKVLSVGGVRVHLQGKTRPCERMDEQCPGLTGALSVGWRGGAYGVILDDGEIRVGDTVALQDGPSP